MWANKWLWQCAAWAVGVFLLVFGGYWAGYSDAKRHYRAEMAKLQQANTQQALASEQAYAAKLAEVQKLLQAQQEKTQAVGIELAQANAAARARTIENKKGIDDAIKQDHAAAAGSCVDGFGAHSLSQYRQALGYAD